jgi:hypothetical protein
LQAAFPWLRPTFVQTFLKGPPPWQAVSL